MPFSFILFFRIRSISSRSRSRILISSSDDSSESELDSCLSSPRGTENVARFYRIINYKQKLEYCTLGREKDDFGILNGLNVAFSAAALLALFNLL